MEINQETQMITFTDEEMQEFEARIINIQKSYQQLQIDINFLIEKQINPFIVIDSIDNFHDHFCSVSKELKRQIMVPLRPKPPEVDKVDPNEVFN